MDVLVFDDTSSAHLMTRYTGNEIHQRRAILTLNMQGGGGFEIWQFTSRHPSPYARPPRMGDIGIFGVKIKAADIQGAHLFFRNNGMVTLTSVCQAPDGSKHFWITDSDGNNFNIIEGRSWFKPDGRICGGVAGATIGVSDMEKAISFYRNLLGIDEIVYDITGNVQDAPGELQTSDLFRRVLLRKKSELNGAFSKLFGCVEIELIESKNYVAQKIFAGRFWGDCGFIHLCFDVTEMEGLKASIVSREHFFTVDSADTFSMGNAGGRFCYMEDPDGTLIELVETHKVPVFKKFGIYFNLKKRKSSSPLPDWMVKLLGMNKIR